MTDPHSARRPVSREVDRPIDPRDRFSVGVDAYRAHRPSYPGELIRWIVDEIALRADEVVIDVGCGTGISSRALAAAGLRVIGVDPNAAMLEAARVEPVDTPAATGGAPIAWLVGDAESFAWPSSLAEVKVGAIVGGQCFHWFDLDTALPHFASLLPPGRRIVAFWNLRDPSDPLMAAYEQLLRERCPDYLAVGPEVRAARLLDHPLVDDVRSVRIAGHRQSFDRDGFIGRVWSSSYVRRSIDDASRADFDAALHRLFDAHARDGRVEFVYQCVAYAFSVRRGSPCGCP